MSLDKTVYKIDKAITPHLSAIFNRMTGNTALEKRGLRRTDKDVVNSTMLGVAAGIGVYAGCGLVATSMVSAMAPVIGALSLCTVFGIAAATVPARLTAMARIKNHKNKKATVAATTPVRQNVVEMNHYRNKKTTYAKTL